MRLHEGRDNFNKIIDILEIEKYVKKENISSIFLPFNYFSKEFDCKINYVELYCKNGSGDGLLFVTTKKLLEAWTFLKKGE